MQSTIDNKKTSYKSELSGKMHVMRFNFAPPLIPYPVVYARIGNSAPFVFLVDTGTSGLEIYVEHWVSDDLRLSKQIEAAASKQIGKDYVRVQCAPLVFEDPRTKDEFSIPINNAITSRRNMLSTMRSGGNRLAGIIGLEFFERFVTQFDYARGELRLKSADSYRLPQFQAVKQIGITRGNNRAALVSIPADNNKPIQFLLDTGSDISHMPADRLIRHTKLPTPYMATTATGSVETSIFHISAIDLAGIRVTDLLCASAPTDASPILGSDILALFLVTIDLTKNRVFLELRQDLPAKSPMSFGGALAVIGEPSKNKSKCIRFAPKGSCFQVGDTLSKVDGVDVSKLSVAESQRLLDGWSGSLVKIEGKRDNEPFTLEYTRPSRYGGRVDTRFVFRKPNSKIHSPPSKEKKPIKIEVVGDKALVTYDDGSKVVISWNPGGGDGKIKVSP